MNGNTFFISSTASWSRTQRVDWGLRPCPEATLVMPAWRRATPTHRCGVHCDHIRFTARCRARRSDLAATRRADVVARLLLGHCARCTAHPQASSADTPTSPPPVMQAALQGGLHDEVHREQRSARKRPPRRRSQKPALHRRISALPDRRSHWLDCKHGLVCRLRRTCLFGTRLRGDGVAGSLSPTGIKQISMPRLRRRVVARSRVGRPRLLAAPGSRKYWHAGRRWHFLGS